MKCCNKVSVVIPTYNRLPSLKRAIASVLEQIHANLEIIVVDDGSSDGTREYLASLHHPKISPLCLTANQGATAARNAGIEYAGGKYIAFLDDDDEWLPDKLEKQVDILDSNPDIGIVYSAAVIVLDNMKIEYKTVPRAKGMIFDDLLISNVIGSTSTVTLRRELLFAHGMFDERMPSMQDYELWIRLSKYTKVDFVKEPLIVYHCTLCSISKNTQSNVEAFTLISSLYKKEIECLPAGLRKKRLGWFNATLGLKCLYNSRRLYAATYFIRAFFLTFAFRYLLSSLLSAISPALLFRIRSKISAAF